MRRKNCLVLCLGFALFSIFIQQTSGDSRIKIMGNGNFKSSAIVSYIMSKKPSMPRQEITVLVNEYISEAKAEGINHDLAIAQMCYATGFLTNRPLMNTHNYAGLNTDLGISVKHGRRHLNMQEGVWAHIQHLKGYASTECPNREIVNRRYALLVRRGIPGTVKTLEGLAAIWSPYNPRYECEIVKIIRELRLYSGRSN